ncbi:helix-turn-helix domain-containing protein [Pseudogracilibacillus auburnensis]|uniref:helix-turn-helix domain-containing protein n=1 Tax=Pseudogracilibacillus auburnensis TaxID=1494959 RepID=UPI001A97C81C|nr:helix-turn-helix transcriptional regulator [Pseudogracilibacillus auburnensis]MBO1004234.1 helix-turn-helix transcriptional regulator [Pseudogracilibacillus auburnensis]
MTFGEKLFKLRKEKGFSQEALAEKLNTTRQAISKWENGQGYPETEKLLMIGNIFGVSMDYLLKDTSEQNNETEAGYYVSKEMAEGFLLSSKKMARYTSFGLFFIALAFIPYFIFNQDPTNYLIPTIIFGTIGVGCLASTSFLEEDQYKILKQEPLLFDEKYLQELNIRYENRRKKYAIFMIVGFASFALGFFPIGLEKKNIISADFITPYFPISIGLMAIGIYILTHTSTILDGYKLLAKNELYTNRLRFKLRKKVRQKVDEF